MGADGDSGNAGDTHAAGCGNSATVHIRCSNGSKFSVQTSLDSTVEAFKAVVAWSCDVPAEQQRLIYKGRILKDDQTLASYGLESDHTIHLVRGAAPSSANAAASNLGALRTPNEGSGLAGAASGGSPFPGLGINGPDGLGGSGLSGIGLPELHQVQQQLTQNPNIMREIMNMPAIQNLMNNPELMRNIIMSNPQMREIIDRNPDLAHILNDPSTLRQTLEAARNPELMREIMRNTDRAMSNIESSPEGFNMLRRMYETVQEPFLNATTMAGNNGMGSNPFAALLGNRGATHNIDRSPNPSTTGSESATGSPAPNTNPLPNPWSTNAGSGQAVNSSSTAASNARAPGIAGLGGLDLPDLEQMVSGVQDSPLLSQVMQNPAIVRMVQNLLSDPQYMNQGLLETNAQLRERLEDPEVFRRLTSPETIQQLLSFQQSLLSVIGQRLSSDSSQEQNQTGGGTGFSSSVLGLFYFDLLQYRPSSAFNSPFWTTNSGAPVWNNNSSLTVGTRGPILLEDYHVIEKLAQFDRERIPERVVHARGASAKGFFEVTHDVSHLTCADFLRAPGVQTPVIVRFSTVIHERGSPETLRDPRGFAVKFYTREGNFDLVGNNFPVFFIRDGIKFPDMVHSLKPNPKSHIQENWRILDFFSHHPESLHMFTFLFDDVGVPADYRHMDGSGVNTYTLINKEGKARYVKFHWRPTCGVKCLLEDEAVIVGGNNHSHATKDLYDSIAAGNYPEWKLYIQTIDPDHEDQFDFDPLDVTKTWPEDILPLQPVGRMVLNKNIDNFFAENEQLAFCPAIVVPGIYYSDDKLLQTRIFSYADTQRHRLGPNYLMLPANAPKCAHHNNHHDGFMNFMHRDEEVNYFPSRYDPVRHAERFPISSRILTGRREKCVIHKENNFKQPGERYRSWDPNRQERFIRRWVEALSDPRVTHEIQSIWISYWSQCDKSLGQKMATRRNVKPCM
ncbi:putative Catalase isozyme 1 [Cocos nucifera]|uniref:Catalase n=1 Tax=Cocos nucifera TaxID=13894 RepID=A0A8K0IGA8_COCNU|nr:putative Catalase isozyme 1 [Cocos nucifera]